MTQYKKEKVKKLINKALGYLYKNDYFLIEEDVNERSISHKLAEYLHELFPEYHVDCEYNRVGRKEIDQEIINKKLDIRIEGVQTNDTEAKTVYPDIIVHRRNTKHNLLIIEVKKNAGRKVSEVKKDYKKLLGFIKEDNSDFKYKYAAFINLQKKLPKLEVFEGGNANDVKNLKKNAKR